METNGNKVIWVLVVIAAIAGLVFLPVIKSAAESISERAHNDTVFAFGIITLVALLIFGCVAVIAQNLRR